MLGNESTLFALAAYLIWGVAPLFWQFLPHLASIEHLRSRVLFSLLLILPLNLWMWSKGKIAIEVTLRNLLLILCAAALIGFNWFLYVWAVTHGHVVESSLGYFINPLLNVLFGTLIFREVLPRLQAIACAIASVGILILSFSTHHIPWIALLLAASFGLYGVCKKIVKLHPLASIFFEALILLGPCFLIPPSTELHLLPLHEMALLPFAGLVSTVPLICFAYAAQCLPLSFLGFAQFLSPSIQFLLGIFFFQEAFSLLRGISFLIIWIGCLIFILDIFLRSKQNHLPLKKDGVKI